MLHGTASHRECVRLTFIPLQGRFIVLPWGWLHVEACGPDVSQDRYTKTLDNLYELETWWKTLTGVDRAAIANTSKLIQTCESIIQAETNSWMATTASFSEEFRNDVRATHQAEHSEQTKDLPQPQHMQPQQQKPKVN